METRLQKRTDQASRSMQDPNSVASELLVAASLEEMVDIESQFAHLPAKDWSGTKAVWLSTLKAIHQFKQESKSKWALILQDDAELPLSPLKDTIQHAVEMASAQKAGVVWMDARTHKSEDETEKAFNCCMDAMLISQDAVPALLRDLHPRSEWVQSTKTTQGRGQFDWTVGALCREAKSVTCTADPQIQSGWFDSTLDHPPDRARAVDSPEGPLRNIEPGRTVPPPGASESRLSIRTA